jgi:hypothetical protein
MFSHQTRVLAIFVFAAGLAPPPQESFKEYVARVRGVSAPDLDADDRDFFATMDDRWFRSSLDAAKLPPKLRATMQARRDAAEVELEWRWKEFNAGRGTLDILFGASERMLRSESEVDKKRDHQVHALERQLKRMQEILKVNKARFEAGRIPVQDVAQTEFYYQEAKLRLEQAKEK